MRQCKYCGERCYGDFCRELCAEAYWEEYYEKNGPPEDYYEMWSPDAS